MPEGHCGGFGTSSRMWCGTLKRLGTRPRWTRQPRAPAAGVQLEEYNSDLSAPTGRLGCRRGSPQSPRREAPSRAGTCSGSPRAGPPATNDAPLARTTAAPPLTDLLKWTARQFGRIAGRRGSHPETRARARCLVQSHRGPRGPSAQRDCSTSACFLVGLGWKNSSLPRCSPSCLQPDAVTCGPWSHPS